MLLSISKLKIIALLVSFCPLVLVGAKPGYKHLKCESKPCKRSSRLRPNPRIDAKRRSKNVSVSSGNWCGYVSAVGNLNSPLPHTVTKVSGSWQVPSLQASAVDTSASIWVGIDGAGSPSVEQLGTEHDVKGGRQSHYAWYEMFPAGSNLLVGFPVEVGDIISASVAYVTLPGILPQGTSLFIMEISNDTKRVYSVIPCFSSIDLQRLCAEWIVEAPWLNTTLPLSNFGTAFLFNCAAEINNVAGAINNPSWLYESMNMVASGNVMKAIASPLSVDGKSFSVVWKHN